MTQGTWVKIMAGHYNWVDTDGTTVLCTVIKEPSRRAQGMLGPDMWTAYIYPLGHIGWMTERRDYKTLKEAKGRAEMAYRYEVSQIKTLTDA